MYKGFIKRVLDLLLSAIAIILLSPIFLLVFILLNIANKGSVFFTQLRPGKKQQNIQIIKV